jgi:lysophospholipid hydrolase
LDEAKNTPGCLYFAMPVQVSSPFLDRDHQLTPAQQHFETLGGFSKFNEVYQVGLHAGRKVLQQWKEEGRLPTGLVDDVKGEKAIKRGARLRRMSI